MKQKIITITVLLFFCINFLYAADDNRDANTKDQSEKVDNAKQIVLNGENISAEPILNQDDYTRNNSERKFFKKRKKRILERFVISNLLSPQKFLPLMIVGFALLLPGMVLAMLGVALIPAIILAVVGGTLFIIGLLIGK